jgi:hypothetical protein
MFGFSHSSDTESLGIVAEFGTLEIQIETKFTVDRPITSVPAGGCSNRPGKLPYVVELVVIRREL